MKNVLVTIALALTTSCSGFKPATLPAFVNKAGDTPKCLAIEYRQAVGYAIVVHSMAFTVAQDGGTEEVESKLTDGESKLAGIAIRDLYQYALSNNKCWSLTQAQSAAMLKACEAMSEYIKTHQLQAEFVKYVVNNLGGKDQLAQLAVNDYAEVTKVLVKRSK